MGERKRASGSDPSNLYERNGVWYFRIQVNGRERRGSLQTRVRREAERRLKAKLKEFSPYHGTIRATYKEAAALWLEAGNWKPKTTAGYLRLLTVLERTFGDRFWDEVDKGALLSFMDERRAAKATAATINRYLTVISGIAKHVMELPGWPDINPVELLPRKPRKEKRRRYVRPPPSDIEAIFARMKGTFGDLCRVALLTGARRDELATLRWSEVRGDTISFVDTKNHTPRTVSLDPAAHAIVARQPNGRSDGPVFVTRNGGRYLRVTEMWREVTDRAQKRAQQEGTRLTRLRFHDLRHEYAIRYLESGGSLFTLQKLLGHGSIRQTEEYLAYLTPQQAARVREGSAQ